jgi:hypothetical protein
MSAPIIAERKASRGHGRIDLQTAHSRGHCPMMTDEERRAKKAVENASYRRRNRDKIAIAKAKYQRAHRAERCAYECARRARNPQAVATHRACTKRYYLENRERILAAKRALYAAEPKEVQVNREQRKWRRKKKKQDDVLMARIRAAVNCAPGTRSAWLPSDIREELVGEIGIAVATRKLKRRDIELRVVEFVRSHTRAARYYSTISLDAPIYEDGTSRLDMLQAPEIEESDED